MALRQRLEVRQTQGLTLTPQLMASIKLLQLSHIELSAFIDAELLANPLLEIEDAAAPATDDTGEPSSPDAAPEVGEADFEDSFTHTDPSATADDIAANYDTDVENIFPEQPAANRLETAGPWAEPGSPVASGDVFDIGQLLAARPSLAEHLTAQIGLLLDAPAERLIARYLTDSLNEAGYLTTGLDAVATALGADLALVEAVLLKIQGCDPLGVFARSPAECLAIQLRERDRLDPLMARLLEHLDLVAAHDMAGLARAVGASRDDLADMLAELRRLDPRPGLAFERGPVETLVPDVYVRPAPAGGWAIELNADILPRVLVNRTYYATVAKTLRYPTEKSFLVDCLATANWLTKSLDQRAQTILKVAAEIVKQQDGFLVHGITHLRPMTLRMVADAIEMHESTVSRVTSNKYMATPRGLFEMKYFFTTALASSSGDADHSSETVRHRLRQLVEAEPADAILSDDTIAELLAREQGIAVARRTIAKYREAMNIPSSVIRRRQKHAEAAR